MADKKIQLKRNTDGTIIDNLFPVARITDIVESDGTTSFLDGGKIRFSYLPNSVFDSLFFSGTWIGNADLWTVGKGLIDYGASINRSAVGMYYVSSGSVVLTGHNASSSAVNVGSTGVWVKAVMVNSDEGGYADGNVPSNPTTTTLESGDWFVLTNIEGSGTSLNPYFVQFAMVENTYEDATSSIKGIVQLSASTSTATTGNAVITNGILNGLIGTTSTTIAAGNHLHTDVYEPHNDGLTDLATLLTTGTSGFVRVNGVNDASLDTNSYLNASTTSTQSGYFGNIHLQDDSTPSHYLGITASSNLTANRTLSLATGDADRTLTFGGNITTTAGNLTINAQAAGSTLSLPSILTVGAVTANGILYGSSANNVGMIASSTIGRNTLTIPDIAAISFARYNADETISMLSAADYRTAIGAGTSSTTGTVTAIATNGAITGGTITTTGTISHSTADGNLHVPATSTTNNRKFLVAGSTSGTFAWEAFPRMFYDTTSGTISGDIIFDEVA
jgi:hypothetical protein